MADIYTLRTMIKKLNRARANGDPEKYNAMLTVAEAHRIGAAILALIDENERLRAALLEIGWSNSLTSTEARDIARAALSAHP